MGAQPPQLGPIREHLAQARAALQSLPAERQVLSARLELLQHQAGQLQQRRGNWDQFLRVYRETQGIIAQGGLPEGAMQHWRMVEQRMAEAGAGAPTSGATSQPDSNQPQPEQLQEALAMTRVLLANLPPAPAGTARANYLRARDQLNRLGNLLQISLQEARKGAMPSRYSELLVERARYYLVRDGLKAPGDYLRPLDDALKNLP